MAKSKQTAAIGAGYDYGKIKVRAKDGTLVTSSGTADAVARAMLLHLVVNGGTINQVIAANGLKVKKGPNDGLVRMAVGNTLRGLVRNGIAVEIGAVMVKTLKQAVALPKVEPKAAKPAKAKKAKRKVAKPARVKKAKRKVARKAAPMAPVEQPQA